MKAVVCTKYGPPEVLKLTDVAKPVPKDNEVLVKVHATVLSPADLAFRTGRPFVARFFIGGLLKPKAIPGYVLAGEIEAVGDDVKRFKVGDRVFGEGGPKTGGAQAEFVCLSDEEALTSKPGNLSYGEAAGIADGALTALPFLRDRGRIEAGQRVLINGASGSIGTMAVQLAKHFGADVTGVCSGKNVELVRSLGADHVIDYTKEDFTKADGTYDVIFDVVGKSSFSRCRGALKDGGIYLTTVPDMAILIRMLWPSKLSKKRARFAATGLRPPGEKTKDLVLLGKLAEEGKVRVVIDRTYPLEGIVEAHRFVAEGHKRGVVVIQIINDEQLQSISDS
jgi:NADPH:quinone reductase-like Zn-dependent oxidoreductase